MAGTPLTSVPTGCHTPSLGSGFEAGLTRRAGGVRCATTRVALGVDPGFVVPDGLVDGVDAVVGSSPANVAASVGVPPTATVLTCA